MPIVTHGLCTCGHAYSNHCDDGSCMDQACECYNYREARELVVTVTSGLSEANLTQILELIDRTVGIGACTLKPW